MLGAGEEGETQRVSNEPAKAGQENQAAFPFCPRSAEILYPLKLIAAMTEAESFAALGNQTDLCQTLAFTTYHSVWL